VRKDVLNQFVKGDQRPILSSGRGVLGQPIELFDELSLAGCPF
jgi:hypothetical protein